MTVQSYDLQKLQFDRISEARPDADRWHFVWAHGWGQNRQALKLLAQPYLTSGTHDFLDLPGFGGSPVPETAWTTADYADVMARWISENATGKPIVWTGHSFGGRVGIQLAARHAPLVDRMLLLAAAGLPRERSALEKVKLQSRIYTFKALKRLAPLAGISEDQVRAKFGSADYRSAGAMRGVFLNAVREDLTDVARQIRCPVALVYGTNDTEAPPDIGERLAKLIPGATLSLLEGLDHYSVLADGRHQVAKRLNSLLGA